MSDEIRTALVTGGCGFLGSHIVRALLDKGANTDLLNNDNKSALDWATENNHDETVQMLRDAIAVKSAKRSSGTNNTKLRRSKRLKSGRLGTLSEKSWRPQWEVVSFFGVG